MALDGPKQDFKYIGTRPDRPDGWDKVTGKARFGADFSMPGMLHGAILRSPHAHAKIIKIDATKALALKKATTVIYGRINGALAILQLAMMVLQ